jgi:hypothetical protein
VTTEKCSHPEAYVRWKYEGGKEPVDAAGYCRDCGIGWKLNKETKNLEEVRTEEENSAGGSDV